MYKLNRDLPSQALGTFGLCQLYAFAQYLRAQLSPAHFESLFKALLTTLLATLGTAAVALTLTGKCVLLSRSVVQSAAQHAAGSLTLTSICV